MEQREDWTINELSADAGVPSRTIREYQRLNLLPPPRREGRVGRYGPTHRARLSIIDRLQKRGFSLAAIGDLMESWERGRGLGSVLGVDADPAVLDEIPTEMSIEQLHQIVPAFSDEELLAAATEAGLVHRIDESTVIIRSIAAVELVDMADRAGMPASAGIEIATHVWAGAAAIATAVVDEFIEHLRPRHLEVDVDTTLTRARLLLAQASASLVVHELGVALRHHADRDDSGELMGLLERLSIGQVRRLG